MQLWQLIKISGRLLPLLVLLLTALALPSCMTNQPAKPFSSESLPTEAIAEISEIRSFPVRVKYVNSKSARPASVGVPLKADESVTTEETSTAQLTLRNGSIIRIGGNSNLTLKPQNKVEFTSGRLVAWAASDRKATAQIQTPFGEISSNDGTIYLEIPAKAAEDRRIIALTGTVTVLLKSTAEIVTIGKGEEIVIKANGKASAPKRIDKESIDKRVANNSLLFGFNTQLASLSQITSEFGVSSTVKEASTIQFRRSDLPSKPSEVNNSDRVTYTSGSANNDQREQPVNRRYEEPAAVKTAEPVSAPKKPTEPIPSATFAPVTAPPTATEPKPITNSPTAIPIEPAPLQPVPLEPPPQPVQPEIPAPVPPSTKPAKG